MHLSVLRGASSLGQVFVRQLSSTSTNVDETLPSYRFIKDGSLSVISTPFSFGQPRGGVEDGPRTILEHGPGLLSKIKDIRIRGASSVHPWQSIQQINVQEAFESALQKRTNVGSSEPATRLHRCLKTGLACDITHTAVAKEARAQRFALTLGGDHSLALGSISGIQAVYKDVGVIWVDAHADINTAATSPSGNLHGCPVSFLLGLDQGSDARPGFEWLEERRFPLLNPNRIAYIGLRDVDSGERALLAKHNILAFSMREVRRLGIEEVVTRCIEHIDHDQTVPIHCSFDIDAIDPIWANSTGTPVVGGLSVSEGIYINESLARTGRLVSLDLVEVNPNLGTSDDVFRTALTAQTLITAALGQTYLN